MTNHLPLINMINTIKVIITVDKSDFGRLIDKLITKY